MGLADALSQILMSLINWVHLIATVTWIGAMTTNILVLLPSTREVLDAAIAGRLMGAVMRRFRRLAYASILLFLVSGVPLALLNENYSGFGQFTNPWTQIILLKHIFVTALIVLAVYAFEVLAPKVARTAAKGPSPELASLQKLQLRMSVVGLGLGLVILLLAGMALSI